MEQLNTVDDNITGDIDKFIDMLESGVFEQQWIKERLAVIKSNEEYRAGKADKVILDASES